MKVFYFTASGNCLDIAKRLDKNPVSIPQELKKESLRYKDDVIGIVAPDYSSRLPEIVQRFIKKAEFEVSYFFILVTYGCDDRISAMWAKEFAEENGVAVNYANTVLMVDNWLPGFDMSSEMAQDKQIDEQMRKIKSDIEQRVDYVLPVTEEDKKNYEIGLTWVEEKPEMTNGSLIHIDERMCVGCGVCTKVCPIGNIRVAEGKAVRNADTCEFCMACAHNCPQKAIVMQLEGKLIEVNSSVRFRNSNVTLNEIIQSNDLLGE